MLIQTYGAEFLKKGSGGALFDPKTGTLLGIASFYINDSQSYECHGSTFFSSAVSMLKALEESFPNITARETLNCNANAFAPIVDPHEPSIGPPKKK